MGPYLFSDVREFPIHVSVERGLEAKDKIARQE
jgi:hypothetical protein